MKKLGLLLKGLHIGFYKRLGFGAPFKGSLWFYKGFGIKCLGLRV